MPPGALNIMQKIYLIGGAPRMGKTKMMFHVLQSHPTPAVSTDALRHVLRSIYTVQQKPNLFAEFNTQIVSSKLALQDKIMTQNSESVDVWPAVMHYIESNHEDGLDVLVEGVAVLPEFLQQFPYKFQAIFIGNQSHDHVRTILSQAKKDQYDWLHNKNEKEMYEFATYVTGFSQYIQKEAEKYGFQYFETKDTAFESSLDWATKVLLG